MKFISKKVLVWRGDLSRLFLLLIILSTCQCGVIGDPESVIYDLFGTVRNSTDSTLIDSLVVRRTVLSNKIGMRGNSNDSVVHLNGNYQIPLIAFIKPNEAIRVFNAAKISFRIERPGYISIDTTFSGQELPVEKYGRSSFDVDLPVLYMAPDTSTKPN